MSALGRGCVETLSEANFGGRRTITRAPIVDPGASNELDEFLGPSISEFSHSLGRLRTLLRQLGLPRQAILDP